MDSKFTSLINFLIFFSLSGKGSETRLFPFAEGAQQERQETEETPKAIGGWT